MGGRSGGIRSVGGGGSRITSLALSQCQECGECAMAECGLLRSSAPPPLPFVPHRARPRPVSAPALSPPALPPRVPAAARLLLLLRAKSTDPAAEAPPPPPRRPSQGLFSFVTDNDSSRNAIQLPNAPAMDGNTGQMIAVRSPSGSAISSGASPVFILRPVATHQCALIAFDATAFCHPPPKRINF